MDSILGSLLVSSWCNSALVTVECVQLSPQPDYPNALRSPRVLQFLFYLKNYSGDGWIIKTVLVMAIGFDFASSVGVYSSIYLYSITHFGDVLFASSTVWGLPLCTLATGLTAMICRSFLNWRLLRLTHNPIICGFIGALTMASLGAAFATCIELVTVNSLSQRHDLKKFIICWLVTSVTADLILAGCLVWFLQSMKSSFEHTDFLLTRLTRRAVETGSVTTFFSLAALVLYFVMPRTNVDAAILMILGRIYTLTTLSNLNQRRAIPSGIISRATTDSSRVHEVIPGRIQVTRHAVTHMDDPLARPGHVLTSVREPVSIPRQMTVLSSFVIDLEGQLDESTSKRKVPV